MFPRQQIKRPIEAGVFPVRAGVFLTNFSRMKFKRCIPRESGGVSGKEVATISIWDDDYYDYYDEYHPFDDENFKSGRDFEIYCVRLLQANGFSSVRRTGESADHGVDILAVKDGKLYAVQCKLRSNSTIPRSAIAEIYTGKALYGADEGILMTNSELTRPAYQDAMRLGITVWTTFYLRLLSDNIE